MNPTIQVLCPLMVVDGRLIATEDGLHAFVRKFADRFPDVSASVYCRSQDVGACINISPEGQRGRLVFDRFRPAFQSDENYYLIFSVANQRGEFHGLVCAYSDFADPGICQSFVGKFVPYLKTEFSLT